MTVAAQNYRSDATESEAIVSDIVIVGGGIVGATLACALKDTGLKIVIVEAQPQHIAVNRQQAYSLSILSSQILEQIGVWQYIFPDVGKYRHIRLSDADSPLVVKFDHTELNRDFLGYVGQHQTVLTALYRSIAQSPQISWLSPATVTAVDYGDGQAQIQTIIDNQPQTIYSRLVVGADGRQSRIREAAGIQTRGWKYWQSCVAFKIKHQATENDTAFERFWHSGPMGILPLPDNRCQIVWTAPHVEAQNLKTMPQAQFIELLEQRTGGLLGRLQLDGDRNLFKVQLMQSNQYIKPRLALIGDAAHCCHPVGGQGLNLGIRDAASLAQVITQAHQQGKDIGSVSVLKQYSSWRKLENLTILGFTDLLDRMFSNNWLAAVALRRSGLWLMRQVPPVKIFALKLMTGLKGRTPDLGIN